MISMWWDNYLWWANVLQFLKRDDFSMWKEKLLLLRARPQFYLQRNKGHSNEYFFPCPAWQDKGKLPSLVFVARQPCEMSVWRFAIPPQLPISSFGLPCRNR